jgi:uncharacterized protein
MERTLTDFIRALRSAGAQVSSSEAIDAANTLALIGYADRQLMKDSLSVVLAKSEEEKQIHDQLFEAFFSRRTAAADSKSRAAKTAASPTDHRDSEDPGGQSGGPGGEPGDEPGSVSSGEPGADRSGEQAVRSGDQPGDLQSLTAFLELAQSGDADRIAVAMERAGSAVGVDEIRFSSQTPYYVRRMLEHLGVEALEAQLSSYILDAKRKSQAQAQVLMDARTILQRHARNYVDQRFELFGKSATESFMNDVVVNREIGQLGLRDMERMKALVARMAKRLAVRHSRRRKVRNRGQLDIRRTMRANAGNDGIPFELIWKLKRKDRPKIVAICDVSGSVAQYVRFLLLFLYALKDEVTDLGAFAFSARLKDVSHELETLSFEKAMDSVINEVGGGGTDYGQALLDLKVGHWEVIDRRTTILILGDGRSNHTDPRLDIFQEAVDRAKRVVWLCPEPPRRWGTGDSCVLQYKPFCTHLSHCATALDLERALDEVLMAYD